MTFAKPVSILGGVRTMMRGKNEGGGRERGESDCVCTIRLSYNTAWTPWPKHSLHSESELEARRQGVGVRALQSLTNDPNEG